VKIVVPARGTTKRTAREAAARVLAPLRSASSRVSLSSSRNFTSADSPGAASARSDVDVTVTDSDRRLFSEVKF
jgi:hypothetical protein